MPITMAMKSIPPHYSKNVTIADFMKRRFRNAAWTIEKQLSALRYDVDYSELMEVVEKLIHEGCRVTIKSDKIETMCNIFDTNLWVQYENYSPSPLNAIHTSVSACIKGMNQSKKNTKPN
jgi:hypothetical protein